MRKEKLKNINNGKFSILFSIRNLQSPLISLKSEHGDKSAIRNGFSFMELMTVVAIMAILIIASMPAFRNFARGKNLKEGTNMVLSALRKTRDAAITERKNYKTVIDTLNQAIGIYRIDDTIAENWAKLPEFIKFDTNSTDWDVPYNFGGGFEWVEFKPNGAAKLGGSIPLLDESSQDTKTITFNNITGRIRVEE